MDVIEILLILAIGLLAGFVSGSLGVGGGIITVPALVFIMGFSQHQAQGTSLALLAVPVVLPAVYNYYKSGFVDIRVALILIAAFLVGGYLGSVFSVNMPASLLKKIFASLMLVVAVKMFFES